MKTRMAFLWSCLAVGTFFAVSVAGDTEPLNQIQLDRAATFNGPNGAAVTVSEGAYLVDLADVDQLRLWPLEDGESQVIHGESIQHDVQLQLPIALCVPNDDGSVSIALLHPGGEGFEAVGTFGGVAPRGTRVLNLDQSRVTALAGTKIGVSQQLGSLFTPPKGSGVFSGELVDSDAKSRVDYPIEYIQPIEFDAGLFTFSRDYGFKLNWEFHADGPVKYKYSLPFEVTFNSFPLEVFPGQRIYLDTDFSWKPGSLETTENCKFWHHSKVWVDLPDGLDPLSTVFDQYASKAFIETKLPVMPGFPSVPISSDITVAPFNSGGGDFGGSHTVLGGSLKLNSNRSTFSVEGANVAKIEATGPSLDAWTQGHEQFELAAYVLMSIPATSLCGAGLEAFRKAGELSLTTDLQGSVRREDMVMILGPVGSPGPYIEVPQDLKPGDIWRFDEPVKVKYSVGGHSTFRYRLGYDVGFDMRFINPVQVCNLPLSSVDAGWSETERVVREGTMQVSGSVRVVEFYGSLASSSPAVQQETPPHVMLRGVKRSKPKAPSTVNRPVRSDVRPVESDVRPVQSVVPIVQPNTTQVLKKKLRVPVPKATVMQGRPLRGHYTVVVGRYPASDAERQVRMLGAKGITAFAVPVKRSTEEYVTLGSFAAEEDANVVAVMLNEALGLKCDVQDKLD